MRVLVVSHSEMSDYVDKVVREAGGGGGCWGGGEWGWVGGGGMSLISLIFFCFNVITSFITKIRSLR